MFQKLGGRSDRVGVSTWWAAGLLAVAVFGCGNGPTEPPPNGNAGVVPQVGDTLRFFSAVQPDLSADCQDTSSVITGVVRDVGDGFALVEDVAVAGQFSTADYRNLNTELDDVVFPITTAYWGSPADLDGNERVIVLFTAEVNKLSAPDGETFIAGFFWPGDLASRQQCPASNRGELLYVLAPDPNGVFGPQIDLQFARLNARGVVAHEFQHLLTAQQRITKGGGTFLDLEETWLSEGFAHIAEEVAGLAVQGLDVGTNIRFNQAVANTGAFNAYHLQNFRRLGHFFQDPSNTRPVAVQDPGGFASLRMRGFSWMFLRWLADQHVSPAGGSAVHDAQAGRATARALTSSIELGELRIVRGPEEVRSFTLDGGTTGRGYLLSVQSADTIPGATTPMRLRVTTGGSGAIATVHRVEGRLGAPNLSLEERGALGEVLLKENMRRELMRVNPQPLRTVRVQASRSEGLRGLSAGMSGEAELFLELSRGNPGSADGLGIGNVVRALREVVGENVSWQDLLAEFSSMPALTDTDHTSLPSETQVRTWDIRDMFNGLHNSNLGQQPDPECRPFCSPYPLQITAIDLDGSGQAVDFDINASAQKYFVLEGSAVTADAVVELTTQNDGTLPAASRPQITVVRFR